MTTNQMTKASIPKSLLDAKNLAVERFLAPEADDGGIVAFAARPNPKHNVVGVGVGRKIVNGKLTKATCIRFYVEKKIAKGAIPKEFMLPEQVNGIEADVIEAGRFRAFAATPKEQTRIRPARPGCSVGFAFTGAEAGSVMAGTFGAVVEADGKRFILSNNHVLANQNSLPIGSTIFQPGLLDKNAPGTDVVAKLSKFIPLSANNPNQVDCAIAEVTDAMLVSPSVMPKVGKLKSAQTLAAAVGMKVEKTGRTTSFTAGTIHDIAATVKVKYDIGLLTFSNQIIIFGNAGAVFSDSGDSGSLIVEQTGKRAVGLLFGGSAAFTIANHIDDVLSQLGVQLVA